MEVAIKKPNKSKAKGNKFEREVSKLLSNWFFDDDNVLYRESSSGARSTVNKNGFIGDIVIYDPIKFSNKWLSYPLCIECKSGYKMHIPTFINWNKVKEWLVKLINQKTSNQYIIFLICQFHGYESILITDLCLNVWCDISLAIPLNSEVYQFYVYKFKELLNHNFYDLIDDDLKKKILRPPDPILDEMLKAIPS